MKKYFVADWYENCFYPELVGFFDTVEEAEKAIDELEGDTDGECDCIIYPTDNPKYAKILKMVSKA